MPAQARTTTIAFRGVSGVVIETGRNPVGAAGRDGDGDREEAVGGNRVLGPARAPQLHGEIAGPAVRGAVDEQVDRVERGIDRQQEGEVAGEGVRGAGRVPRGFGGQAGQAGRGGDTGRARQVAGVLVGEADHGGVLAQQGAAHQVRPLGGEFPRREVLGDAQGRGGTRGLAERRAGGHDTGGPEGDVGGGDVPPGEVQIRDVRRVEGAQRDVEDAVRVPLARAGLLGVHALYGVEVDRPAAEGDPVLELTLLEDVLLGEDVIAQEAAVLALSGEAADPFQGQVRRVRELAGVLDVVPDTHDHGLELVADALVVVDGVEFAAPLDPPVVAAVVAGAQDAVAQDGRGRQVLGVGGRYELHRPARVPAVEEDRRAEQSLVRLGGRPGLAELAPRLTPDAVAGAGEVAEQAVPGAVEELARVKGDAALRAHHPAGAGVHLAPVVRAARVDLAHVGVEVEVDVRFGVNGVEDHLVPVVGVSLGVAVLVLGVQLAHDPGLAGPAVHAVCGGAADPDADLAAGVAAEDGPVVDQGDASAETGRGDGRAGPRQSAADHGDVVMDLFFPHGAASLV
ncbi:hypothetical protein RKD45_005402 [Streptomyces griseus]